MDASTPPELQPAPGTRFADEYDVRATVPGFDATLAAWAARAATARAALDGRHGLRYGPSADETLDLFMPAQRGARGLPLLVFLHGGFWRRLHKDDFSWIAPPYVARGVAVAVVNYGLAPATALEDIVAQTRRSLAWLWRAAPDFGIDRRRIVVAGHSAGGHLTCMALATDWPALDTGLPAGLIAAGIALSPLADLAPLAEVPVLDADLDFTPGRIAALSPIRHAPASAAPLLGAVGGAESAEFRRQLALLAHHWRPVWHASVPMPGHDHLSVCEAIANPGSALFAASIGLIARSDTFR